MNSKKRILKDSTGFNGDVSVGTLNKKKKLDSVGGIEVITLDDEDEVITIDEEDVQLNPPEANETVNAVLMNSKDSITPVEVTKFLRRKCPVCSDYVPQKVMKRITLEGDRFILAAIIPDRFVSQEQMNEFLKTKSCRVCFAHIVEACTRIEEHIHDPKAVEKMLMPKIQSVNPNLTTTREKCILTQFLFRNKKRTVKPTKDALNFRCYICKKLRLTELMYHFSAIKPKMIIVLGRVLLGTFTLKDAKEYIMTKKRGAVCRKHIRKSIKTIQNTLQIQNNENIDGYSAESMEKMMVTVNSLIPDMTMLQFKKSFKELAKKFEPSLEHNETKIYRNQKCAVCKRLQSSNKQSLVRSKRVKTLILVECVLKGTHTPEEAKRLIESGKLECICHVHFTEAVEKVHKLLEIRNTQEIDDCSDELIKKIMETVNSLLPSMTINGFKDAVVDLAKKKEKFEQQKTSQQLTEADAEVVSDVELIQEQEEEFVSHDNQFSCGVCQLVHPKDKFISVKSAKSKMVMMIGCILRDTHTMEEAEQFITSGNKEYSCRRHFRKSIKKICELLEIEKSSEIFSCSDELMNKLMVKVNSLLPEMTVLEFQTAVLKLSEKIENFEAQKELEQ